MIEQPTGPIDPIIPTDVPMPPPRAPEPGTHEPYREPIPTDVPMPAPHPPGAPEEPPAVPREGGSLAGLA